MLCNPDSFLSEVINQHSLDICSGLQPDEWKEAWPFRAPFRVQLAVSFFKKPLFVCVCSREANKKTPMFRGTLPKKEVRLCVDQSAEAGAPLRKSTGE